jgi:hypothetical protein
MNPQAIKKTIKSDREKLARSVRFMGIKALWELCNFAHIDCDFIVCT